MNLPFGLTRENLMHIGGGAALGLGVGWAVWGRRAAAAPGPAPTTIQILTPAATTAAGAIGFAARQWTRPMAGAVPAQQAQVLQTSGTPAIAGDDAPRSTRYSSMSY